MPSTSDFRDTDWLARLDTSTLEADLRSRIEKSSLLAPATTELTSEPARPQLGTYLDGESNAQINAYAREELSGGAETLLFRLFRQPGPADMETMLDGIPLDRISVHCSLRYPGQDPAELFRDLVRFLRKRNYPLSSVRGSVDFDPLLDWSEPPFPPLIRLLYFVQRWMPHFRVLQVNAAGFNNGPALADTELALALAKATEYLRQLDERGYPPALAAHHLQFALTLGESPVVDIAKLRALRILWAEILAAKSPRGVTPAAVIAAHTDTTSLHNGADEANRLRLAHQAVSASLGGADQLFLAPLPSRRVSRNLQHLLRQEAVLGTANDPLAKAPLLGEMTTTLVDAARSRYRDVQKQGGFATATVF